MDAIDGDGWRDLAAPLIEPILERAKSDPEGLLDDLADVWPAMSSDRLEERLARILFVADLWAQLAGSPDA